MDIERLESVVINGPNIEREDHQGQLDGLLRLLVSYLSLFYLANHFAA